MKALCLDNDSHLAQITGWHGEKGHFNVMTRDHDSEVTGFGKHDRVMSTIPQFDNDFKDVVFYARVDCKWGLGEPTPEEVLNVARTRDELSGEWKLIKRDPWECGNHIDFYFARKSSPIKH